MAYLGRQPAIGRYAKLDDFASSFNGSTTTFNLTSGGDAQVVQSEAQLIVSLGGIIQEPETDYTVSGSQISFTTAPLSGDDFFAILFGDTFNVGVPSDNTIQNRHIKSDASIAMSKLDGSSGSLSALTVDNVILNGSKVRIGAGATGSLGGNLEVSTGSTGAIATFAGASADELYVTNRSAGILGFTTNSADSFEVKSNTTQFVDQSNASIATFTSATSTFAGDVAINGADLFVGNSSSLPSNSDIYMYGATNGTGHIFFNDGANAGSIEYNHATNAMSFGVTSDTEVMRLLSGMVLVGKTTTTITSNALQASLQIMGNAYNNSSISAMRWSANANGASINLGKSRHATVGSNTVVANGDELGKIDFSGDDGTDFQTLAGRISSVVAGTPGTGDIPADLVFSTGDGGSVTQTLRLLSNTNAAFANWLGVGVNPPVRALHVKGGTDTRTRTEESSGTFMDMTVINTGHFLDSVGAVPFTINKHTGSQPLHFNTNNTNRMTVDASGNVGIGVTAPVMGTNGSGLHIKAGVHAVLKLESGADDESKIQFTENGTDQWRIGYDAASGHLEFTESGVADRFLLADGGAATFSGSVSGNTFAAKTNPGIGTDQIYMGFSAPNGLLYSKNSSGAPASNLFMGTTDGSGNTNNVLSLHYDGKVGIGTTTPTQKLDINGTLNIGDGNARLNIHADGTDAEINYINNAAMVFKTNNTEIARFDVYGKLGVNTSSPSGFIHVNGDANSRAFHSASTQTNVDSTQYGFYIDHNTTFSGTAVPSGTDRVSYGFFIDSDFSGTFAATTTAGQKFYNRAAYIHSNATHSTGVLYENDGLLIQTMDNATGSGSVDRLYGILNYTYDYNDAAKTNQYAQINGSFKRAESTGTTTNLYGGHSYAYVYASAGPATNAYGQVGSFNKYNSSTTTTAAAVRGYITGDAGTITTGMGGYFNNYFTGTMGASFGIYTTGFERETFSGNVGIKTTSPAVELHILSPAPEIRIQDSDGTNQYGQMYQASGITYFLSRNNTSNGQYFWNLYDGTTLSTKMMMSTSGNVGIGTTVPNAALTVSKATSPLSGTSNTFGVHIYPDGSTGVCYVDALTNSTSNARLTLRTYNNGTYYAFQFGNTGGLTIPGAFTALSVYNNTTGTGANLVVDSAGGFARSTSSRRYKNTIQNATHGLAELLTLRPVTFKHNNNADAIFGGLIAEEVHDAGLTEFVEYDKEDKPDALQYGNMLSLCIKAIQELEARIKTLEG